MKKVVSVAFAVALAGCARNADQIAAAYVSPLQYDSYNCSQLIEEGQRVSSRAAVVAGVQDQKASSDAVATTVGVIVFWPALFLIKGNDQQTAELARLRGELEAIESASIRKRCTVRFERPVAPPAPVAQPRT